MRRYLRALAGSEKFEKLYKVKEVNYGIYK